MKISKNHLRRIIQEELQSVLSEEIDLDNLAGEIARRNKIGKWMKWRSKEIYQDPTGAFGEMLTAAWSHWTGDRLPMGLSREHQAALNSPEVRTKLQTLLATAQEGAVPPNPINMLDYYVPQNRTPDAALASGLGREHLRGGGSTNPFEDDDDL